MDPFEEFEFKPLTEGLGFHKKAEKTATNNFVREDQQQPVNAQKSQSISDLIASLPPAMDFVDNQVANQVANQVTEKRPQIIQPLGRKDYASPEPVDIKNRESAATALPPVQPRATGMAPTPTLRSPLAAPTTNDISRSFPHLEKNRTTNSSAALRAPTATSSATTPLTTNEKLRKVSSSFAAAILDGMIAIGFASIFLVALLTITQVDLTRLLSSSTTDIQTYTQIGLLFLVVLNLYMISARGIFGSSLGEWAFDLQIGTRAEQRRPIYLVKIVWRMVLVMATGFIALPIISKIFGRDLFAKLGAPQLYNHLARD